MHFSSFCSRATLRASVAVLALSLPAAASAQTWTALTNAPSFGASAMLLLTDGTVMVQDIGSQGAGSGNWWRLTPDNTGSYVNGTWSQLANMPSGYKPLFFASQVLTNGNVIVQGGEYNGSGNGVWTTLGALYNSATNKWTSVAAPSGWTTIGDAQSTLLADGTYMLANCCNTQEVTLNTKTMKYTVTGKNKADDDDEEGWTLLPSGQVLTVDAWDPPNTEILTNGTWATAGKTPVTLPDNASKELGPVVLRPDGTVLAVGATGANAIYTIATGAWTTGPSFPKSGSKFLDEADGPAAVLPDGNVLLAASPGVFQNGTKFFEFDGTNLNAVPGTPNASGESSFQVRLLMLPTGQILEDDGSTSMQVYTPAGSANAAWEPVITTFKATVTHGKTYKLSGTYLNGFTQNNFYGDDYQAATNYPIVRITNTGTGHVFFARTTTFSSMAVANPATVTTKVTIPAGIETGASTVVVVTNGIASAPKNITIN